MARRKKITLLACFLLILLIIPFSHIYGGMKIQLRDGRTVDVPVNKDDIVSITFEDRPMAGGGTTWDFETGDLRGWTATGDAFAFQPTLGDNPTARHRGQPSNHQGQY